MCTFKRHSGFQQQIRSSMRHAPYGSSPTPSAVSHGTAARRSVTAVSASFSRPPSSTSTWQARSGKRDAFIDRVRDIGVSSQAHHPLKNLMVPQSTAFPLSTRSMANGFTQPPSSVEWRAGQRSRQRQERANCAPQAPGSAGQRRRARRLLLGHAAQRAAPAFGSIPANMQGGSYGSDMSECNHAVAATAFTRAK